MGGGRQPGETLDQSGDSHQQRTGERQPSETLDLSGGSQPDEQIGGRQPGETLVQPCDSQKYTRHRGAKAKSARQGMHRSALRTSASFQRVVELFEDRREVGLDAAESEKFLVEFRIALLAIPAQAIFLASKAAAFDDQADGVGGALW